MEEGFGGKGKSRNRTRTPKKDTTKLLLGRQCSQKRAQILIQLNMGRLKDEDRPV